MKINDIITETATAGATASGNIAGISFPMTPGTTHAQAIKAVDPFGKIFKNSRKRRKKIADAYPFDYEMLSYQHKVKDIYPMLRR